MKAKIYYLEHKDNPKVKENPYLANKIWVNLYVDDNENFEYGNADTLIIEEKEVE